MVGVLITLTENGFSQGCGLETGQVNFVLFKGGGWGIIAQFTLASILLAYMLLIWRPGWQSKTKSNCILHHSLWQPDIYLRWENDVITSSVFQKWLLLTRCRVRNWRLTLAWQARHYKLVCFYRTKSQAPAPWHFNYIRSLLFKCCF